MFCIRFDFFKHDLSRLLSLGHPSKFAKPGRCLICVPRSQAALCRAGVWGRRAESRKDIGKQPCVNVCQGCRPADKGILRKPDELVRREGTGPAGAGVTGLPGRSGRSELPREPSLDPGPSTGRHWAFTGLGGTQLLKTVEPNFAGNRGSSSFKAKCLKPPSPVSAGWGSARGLQQPPREIKHRVLQLVSETG